MFANDERIPSGNIFETIRNRICLLDYPPGMLLREAELAHEFEVSRTPIRAVLQRLNHGGLIESKDGVGNIVTRPELNEIRDIYQMRMKMAESIGQMSPHKITESHQSTGKSLMNRAKALKSKFKIEEYWMINHDQHLLISSLIGNSALKTMWDHFYYLSARMWYQRAESNPSNVTSALIAETTEMYRALSENNVTAMGFVQSNYISYGFKKLERIENQLGQVENQC